MKLKITVDSVPYEVDVEVAPPAFKLPSITIGGKVTAASAPKPAASAPPAATAETVKAPLAGTVNRILVDEGQMVTPDEVLLILEAMKMETEIVSPVMGRVAAILVAPGDPVQGGQDLVTIK